MKETNGNKNIVKSILKNSFIVITIFIGKNVSPIISLLFKFVAFQMRQY
jgi:hypothetical protein